MKGNKKGAELADGSLEGVGGGYKEVMIDGVKKFECESGVDACMTPYGRPTIIVDTEEDAKAYDNMMEYVKKLEKDINKLRNENSQLKNPSPSF